MAHLKATFPSIIGHFKAKIYPEPKGVVWNQKEEREERERREKEEEKGKEPLLLWCCREGFLKNPWSFSIFQGNFVEFSSSKSFVYMLG